MTDVTSLTFDRAISADAAILFALEQRVAIARIYEPRAGLAEVLREIEGNMLYLARRGGEVIGSGSYRVQPDGSVYIGNVAVVPACRRQGIARAIMSFLLAACPPAHRITLVTHPDNSSALQLYADLGFVIADRVENYFGDGEPRLRLELRRRLANPPASP